MTNIKPLEDWIAIKRHDYKHPTLFVAGAETHRGTVVAVGPGKWLRRWVEVTDPINGKKFRTRAGDQYGKRAPMDVKPGDVVEYSNAGWSEHIIDGEKYVFTRQGSIIGFGDPEDTQGLQGHNSAVIP